MKMKQIYIFACIILLSCNTVFAGTQFVEYNNAGSVINKSKPEFGSNAIYAPHTSAKRMRIIRQRKLEDAYYKQFENKHNYNINVNLPTTNTNDNKVIENADSSVSNKTSSTDKSSSDSKNFIQKMKDKRQNAKTKQNQRPVTINGVTYY